MEQAPSITPFDLNVLGTPPAFILSQDQTLKILYLMPQLLASALNLISSCLFALAYFSLLLFKGIVEISLSSTLSVSILCALYFLSLFNFQGPSRRPLLGDSLTIISPLFPIVNIFFEKIFIFFRFVENDKSPIFYFNRLW